MCDALSKSPILIDYLLEVDLWHGRFVARALTRLVEKSDPRFHRVARGTSCSRLLPELVPLEQHFVGGSIADPKPGPIQTWHKSTRGG